MSEWQVHGKCIQLSDNDNVCVADNLTDSAQIKEVAAWPKVPRKRDAFQRHMDGLFSPTGWLTVHQPTIELKQPHKSMSIVSLCQTRPVTGATRLTKAIGGWGMAEMVVKKF